MANIYGVDIGTSNFKMCCKDKEDILNEKNIIAIANKKDLLAFGDEAYEMYEKAPENIEVSFPVKFGVIADIENMQTLLLSFFNKINGDKKAPGNTDFYIAVPTDVTEVEKRAFYEPVFAREMAIGVVLCILSVIPIVIAGTMNAADYICAFCVGFLLLIIAVGVNRIIRVSMIKGSYDILLQEGEFSRKEKRLKKKTDVFTNAYWCLATAIYLGWSFWSERWDFTWILWVVAGVLYAALLGIVKVFVKKEE